MGMGQVLMNMIKEVVYFDVWESLFLILLFLIEIRQKISIKKLSFHVFMLSIVNLIISNIITIPILLQLIYILMMSLYFSLVFKTTLTKSILLNTKVYFMLFVLEAILAMIYSFVHIDLLALQNDLIKAIYMIPMKIIEFISIYMYYKISMKGGEIYYEENN